MAFPTTSTLDDFNRADANPISGSWANMPRINTGRLKVLSNQCQPSDTTVSCSDYYTAATYGPDSEAYVTWVTRPTNNGERLELYVRVQNPTSASGSSYRLRISSNGSGSFVWSLWWIDTATTTQIGSNVTQAVAAGEKVGLEIIGSTLKGYLFSGGSWTQVITGTDTHISGAGNVAMNLNGAQTADDFSGGTVVTGGGGGATQQTLTLRGVGS